MMVTKSSIQETIVVLNLSGPVSELIIRGKSIEKGLTGNAYFIDSASRVTELGKSIDDLVKSETGFSTTPPTVSRETRDAHKLMVKNNLRMLRNDVQEVVNANSAAALEIIASASMFAKRKASREKRKNDAVNGEEEGTVWLTAEGSGPHQWRMSLDQKEWKEISPTRYSITMVEDLTPGEVYYFQNKPILSGNLNSNWSQIIKLRIR